MPIYEFICGSCGKQGEFVKSMADFKQDCPDCKKPMDKLVSIPASPVFKGSGFYSTDYKNK